MMLGQNKQEPVKNSIKSLIFVKYYAFVGIDEDK